MSDKITYQDLIAKIAQNTDGTHQFTDNFIKELVEIINEGLERDGKVRVGGFGIFELHHIPETTGTNPRTGKSIPIPAHTRVAYRPAAFIEKHVNRSFASLKTTVFEKPDTAEEIEPSEGQAPAIATPVLKKPATPLTVGGKRKRSRLGDLAALLAVVAAMAMIVRHYYFRSEGGAEAIPEWARNLSAKIAEAFTADTAALVTEIHDEVPSAADSISVAAIEDDLEPSIDDLAAYVMEPETIKSKIAAPARPPVPIGQLSVNGRTLVHKIVEGDHLWNLAEEHYQEPLFWVYIYGANQRVIADPDRLPPNGEIIIPAFEGSPTSPTMRDSVNIALGAFKASNAYKGRNDEWSAYYLRMSRRFQPSLVTAGAH
ncbi:MAG: HU family DNA-binding protein [Candidatus Marinimicrobia bacterium]|nr:HU family DNA-binding protein [Candidatus Neomarinimicrobiota bacterium]